MYEKYFSEFKNHYDSLSTKYGGSTVFNDFVKMCAISIYNTIAKNPNMEQEYLKTINSYDKEVQQIFPKMFGNLIMMFQESKDIRDVLGPFYEKINLGNKQLGQFFTPSHISDFMSEVTLSEDDIKAKIKENGFISMSEPTCGAGGMILSFAKALKNHNINYQQHLLVDATDISETCVYMTYIQLALYGIPAVVHCGDSISQKMRFQMETPLFFMNYWRFRQFFMTDNQESEEKDIIDNSMKKQILFNEATIKGNCQISLW